MIVSDVMSTEVKTIGADAPLKEAATVMVKSGVSGLPVVDNDRRVVGMITEADFVMEEADRSWGRQRRRILVNIAGDVQRHTSKIVSDVMSVSTYTIDGSSSVTEAARMMIDLRVKRLPVVFPDGRLCGIISRADVMGVFARPDDALECEIVNGVARDLLDLSPDEVTVVVRDGVAEISGNVSSRSVSRILTEMAARVEGVVSVESSVTWTHDDTNLTP